MKKSKIMKNELTEQDRYDLKHAISFSRGYAFVPSKYQEIYDEVLIEATIEAYNLYKTLEQPPYRSMVEFYYGHVAEDYKTPAVYLTDGPDEIKYGRMDTLTTKYIPDSTIKDRADSLDSRIKDIKDATDMHNLMKKL